MSLTILERVFMYNGMELPDPDHEMSPEQVLQHYSKQYASLKRGKINIKEETDHSIIYELVKSEYKPNG